jgi:hypothetical protein
MFDIRKHLNCSDWISMYFDLDGVAVLTSPGRVINTVAMTSARRPAPWGVPLTDRELVRAGEALIGRDIGVT